MTTARLVSSWPIPHGLSRRARVVALAAELRVTQLMCQLARREALSLGMDELDRLQRKYPFRTAYEYDPDSVYRRGHARAADILALPGADHANTLLEVACSDGMVSAMLQRAGKHVVAVDRRGDRFDGRAAEAGVRFLGADAQELPLRAASVDLAFSYNSFEHFAYPGAVLHELARVVRRGGHVFLKFGPLYYSPWGEHAYRSITVPYCQFLFSHAIMNEYTMRLGRKPIDASHVNRWSLGQYRQLWREVANVFEPVRYEERRDLSALQIIRAYPSCFKSRPVSFEDFLVSHITAVFRRT